MASQWYYQIMGEEFGPVSPSELRQLAQTSTISADTLVRKGTDGDWVRAERVKGLWGPAKRSASSLGPKEPSFPPKTANWTEESQVQSDPTPLPEMRTHKTGHGTFDDVPAAVGSDGGKTVQAAKWRGKKKVFLLGGVGAVAILLGAILLGTGVVRLRPRTKVERFSEFAGMVGRELPNVKEIDVVLDVAVLYDATIDSMDRSKMTVVDENRIKLALKTVETDRQLTLPPPGEKLNVSRDECVNYKAVYEFQSDKWILRDAERFGWEDTSIGYIPTFDPPSEAVRTLLERSEEF